MKKNVNNRMAAKRKELLFCILMFLLPTLQFVLFYIVTNANSFFLAFKKHEYGMFKWDGTGRFVEVFNDLEGFELMFHGETVAALGFHGGGAEGEHLIERRGGFRFQLLHGGGAGMIHGGKDTAAHS